MSMVEGIFSLIVMFGILYVLIKTDLVLDFMLMVGLLFTQKEDDDHKKSGKFDVEKMISSTAHLPSSRRVYSNEKTGFRRYNDGSDVGDSGSGLGDTMGASDDDG